MFVSYAYDSSCSTLPIQHSHELSWTWSDGCLYFVPSMHRFVYGYIV